LRMAITVRQITPADRTDWLRMRAALWPGSLSDLDADTLAYFEKGSDQLLVLLAKVDGRSVGFVELDERKYAPGCESSPVAFIEGWYVEPDARGSGVGRALVDAAARAAVDRGFTEIASDSEVDNTDAHAAHAALGFDEIERVVCFRKSLGTSRSSR